MHTSPFVFKSSSESSVVLGIDVEKMCVSVPRCMNHPSVGRWATNNSSVEVRHAAAHTLPIINHAAALGKWMQNAPNKQNQVAPEW